MSDPESAKKISAAFEANKNANGILPPKALAQMAQDFGLSPTPFGTKTSEWLVASFDSHPPKGGLTLKGLQGCLAYVTDWKDIFERYDISRAGQLDKSSFQCAITDLGYGVGPSVFDSVWKAYDADLSGSVTLDEFMQAISELSHYKTYFAQHDNGAGVGVLSFDAYCKIAFTLPHPGV
mmetsp:Transcript_39412/g.94708  ORF Transcript_39412/g.94708 Transcript_39412/m.94708 type:complete len:179 (+) Transcript_39412:35-571(+)